MRVKLIVLAVGSACRDIGREWRNRQALAQFEAGQKAVNG